MESDQPPNSETSCDDPKQPSTTTTITEQQQNTTHTARLYECNFCKRGFTNAQALGGHMNIHRKDKTKFKHSSSTTGESPSSTRPRLTTTTSTTDPFSISHQGNLLSVPLPLFDHHETHVVQRNLHQPENPPSTSTEGGVDLELRLGHVEVEQPPESSSENTTTTRKFFS